MITKMGNDEVTVHLISKVSLDYFPDNTLTSFRNFCDEDIALDGDWRVALSENIFPTKSVNFDYEDFTCIKASEVLDSKFNDGNRNTISRPYCGEKFFIKSLEFIFIEHLVKTKLKDKNCQEITNMSN